MSQDLEKLYKAVSSRFDIGSFDEFSSKMQTTDDRKRFYDAVAGKGLDLGDYQQYESRLSSKKKEDTSEFSLDPNSTVGSTSAPEPSTTGAAGETQPQISLDKKKAANNFAKRIGEALPYPEVTDKTPAWAPGAEESDVIVNIQKDKENIEEAKKGLAARAKEQYDETRLKDEIEDESDDFFRNTDAFLSRFKQGVGNLVSSGIGAVGGEALLVNPELGTKLLEVASAMSEGIDDERAIKTAAVFRDAGESTEDAYRKANMGLVELWEEDKIDAIKAAGLAIAESMPYTLAIGATGGVGGAAGTASMIATGTALGYGGTVVEEYARDKDVDGFDQIQSIATGAVEGVLNVALGGAERSAGNLIKKAFKSGMPKQQIKDLLMSTFKKTSKSAVGEAVEEAVQGVAGYYIGSLDGDYTFDPEQAKNIAIESAVVGMGSGGMMTWGSSMAANRALKNSEPALNDAITSIKKELEVQTDPNSKLSKRLVAKLNELQGQQRKLYIDKVGQMSRLPEDTQIKAGQLALEINELELAETQAINNDVKEQLKADRVAKEKQFNDLVNDNSKQSPGYGESTTESDQAESKTEAVDGETRTGDDSGDSGLADGDNTIDKGAAGSKGSTEESGDVVQGQARSGEVSGSDAKTSGRTNRESEEVRGKRIEAAKGKRKRVLDVATKAPSTRIVDAKNKSKNKEENRVVSAIRGMKNESGDAPVLIIADTQEDFNAVMDEEISASQKREVLDADGNVAVEGYYDPDSNTIVVNNSSQMDDNTLIHEATHPVLNNFLSADSKRLDQLVNDAIQNDKSGIFNPVVKEEGVTLENQAEVKKLSDLISELQERSSKEKGSKLKATEKEISEAEARIDELLAEEQKYSPLEQFMALYSKGEQKKEGAVEGFSRAVKTSMESDNKTWRDQAMLFIDRLLVAVGLDRNVVIKSTDDYVTIAAKLQDAFETGRRIKVKDGEAKSKKGSFKLSDTKSTQKNLDPEVKKVREAPLKEETGQTFNLDGTVYTEGGLVVPIASKNLPQTELTPKAITDFIEENKGKLGSDAVKTGIYKFPDRAETSIDLNVVASRDMRDIALEFAKEAGQESLYDLDSFDNVKSGSDGKNPRQFTDQEFIEIAQAFSEGRKPDLTTGDDVYTQGVDQGGSFKKKGSLKAIEETNMIEHLVEDGDDFVFYHRSFEPNITEVDPSKMGSNTNATGREEMQERGGIKGTWFYTKPTEAEASVGREKYEVRIPKDKVYPFNTDPDGFYDEALAEWRKDIPARGFPPNAQVAMITKKAMDAGYDMVIARWRLPDGEVEGWDKQFALRAETQKPLAVTKPGSEGDFKKRLPLTDNERISGNEKIISGNTVSTFIKEATQTIEGVSKDNMNTDELISSATKKNAAIFGLLDNVSRGIFVYDKTNPNTKVKTKKTFTIPINKKKVRLISNKISKLKSRHTAARSADKKKFMDLIKSEYSKLRDEIKSMMMANIEAVYNSLTPEFIETSKKWYEGANRIASTLAGNFNITIEQSSGILAVLSPKNDWFNNIAVAERLIDVLANEKDTVFSEELLNKAVEKALETDPNSPFVKLIKASYAINKGKTFGEILESNNNVQVTIKGKVVNRNIPSLLVRAIDLSKNSNSIFEFDPEGNINKESVYGFVAYMGDGPMMNAISIFLDGSSSNISRKLGNGNKVRNFFNNIIDPFSKNEYITMDTHASAVAFLRPMAADDAGATGLFSGKLSPMYALMGESYVDVAKKVGLLPRELQSVTWEAIRMKDAVNDPNRSEADISMLEELIKKENNTSKDYYERAVEIIRQKVGKPTGWSNRRGIGRVQDISKLEQSVSGASNKRGSGSVSNRRKEGANRGGSRGSSTDLGGEIANVVKSQGNFKKGKKAAKPKNPKALKEAEKRAREVAINSSEYTSNLEANKAKAKAKKEGITVPKDTMWGNTHKVFRVYFTDRDYPVKRFISKIAKQGAKILDDQDAYTKLELLRDKTLFKVKSLRWKITDPQNKNSLFSRVTNAGLDIMTLGKFMAAQHAPERNESILKMNIDRFEEAEKRLKGWEKKLADYDGDDGNRVEFLEKQVLKAKENVSKIANKVVKDNGGMTNEEAKEFMESLSEEEFNAYQEFAAEYREEVTGQILEFKLKRGLISEEAFEEMNKFDYYVPMKVDEFSLTDRVVSSIDPSVKRRTYAIKGTDKYGFSQRVNPAVQGINELVAAYVEGEKNEAYSALYNLAKEHVNDVISVHDPIIERRKVRGIEKTVDLTERFIVDNSVKVFIDGKPKYVEIKDEQLRKTIKRHKDTAEFLPRLKFLSKVGFWLKASNTLWDPEFLYSNIVRDLQAAMISANMEVDKKSAFWTAGKIASRFAQAGAAIAKARATGDYSGKYGQAFLELEEEGGIVSWLKLNEVGDEIAKIQELTGKDGKVHPSKVKNLMKYLEALSDSVELSTRLSTYMMAREAGLSKQQAASLAKNVTVNFDKKGIFGPVMNVLWLFYNASIQGSIRTLQSIYYSPKVRWLATSLMAAGIGEALLWTSLGLEDEYEKIPEHEKERNFIIPVPGSGHYIPIAMSYGFNVFKYAGNNLHDVGKRQVKGYGGKSVKQSIGDMASAIGSSFLPNYSASIAQAIAPTILDPVVQQIENLTWFGAPLAPENYGKDNRVEHEAYNPSTPKEYVNWAKAINDATNFSEETTDSGIIDWSPEVYENYVNFAGGGLGRMVTRSANLIVNATKPEDEQVDIPASQIPFLRKVWKEIPEIGDYYNKADEIIKRSGTDIISKQEREYLYELLDNLDDSGMEREYVSSMKSRFRGNQRDVRRQLRDND